VCGAALRLRIGVLGNFAPTVCGKTELAEIPTLQALRRLLPVSLLCTSNRVSVARAVTFLASDAASFITGEKISVNGDNTLE
jgi:NAD(P)-dependent dehydrogenase (short-subunit alcohol dehydrogenase family)